MIDDDNRNLITNNPTDIGGCFDIILEYVVGFNRRQQHDRFGRKITILYADGLFFAGSVIMAILPGTWRWMLGMAAVPAVVQLALMFSLPESPRWLGRKEESIAILKKIYPPEEVEAEIKVLSESTEKEIKEAEFSNNITIVQMMKTKAIRRGLYAGMGLAIFQQFLAGFASNQTALLLSLITSGLNAFGSILRVVGSLILLTVVFHQTAITSPLISPTETANFNSTCPGYSKAIDPAKWDCMTCLKDESNCGFCDSTDKLKPGAYLIQDDASKERCASQHRDWYTQGCPSNIGWLAIVGLAVYIIFFSPGMGTVPWVINSEIHPLRYRGICGGIASTTVWVSNLIVSQSFLSVIELLGTAWTFLAFGVISCMAIVFVIIFVPETKGVPMEEMEKLLEERKLGFDLGNKPSS
ncbi:inositol transporter, putative [Medicago truncatula]|uniref:Inositol transporter, putative n=1 Tax=Medicago truncatula TaxID=3880 RepID=G7KG01_MEDTR|nr:inositol transporter, putative [Medicago truncatula]